MDSDFSIHKVPRYRWWVCYGVAAAALAFSSRHAYQQVLVISESHRDSNCRGQLKRIGMAIYNYHQEFNTFPPHQNIETAGTECQSWRRLLLPYLSYEREYPADLHTIPWNDERNKAMITFSPHGDFYSCPPTKEIPQPSNFVVVTGLGSAWPNDSFVSFDDIRDPRQETVLVLEIQHSVTPWCNPVDLDINDMSIEQIGANHMTHFNALFADLHVRPIRADVSMEILRSLATIDGGETVYPTEYLFVK